MTLNPLACECIAKRWCNLMGLSPYEMVPHTADPAPDGSMLDGIFYSPRWRLVAREVPAQVAWYHAITGEET